MYALNFNLRYIRRTRYIPPPGGRYELHIDGSSKGDLGPLGVGGIMKSKNGDILISFAGPAGIGDQGRTYILQDGGFSPP